MEGEVESAIHCIFKGTSECVKTACTLVAAIPFWNFPSLVVRVSEFEMESVFTLLPEFKG